MKKRACALAGVLCGLTPLPLAAQRLGDGLIAYYAENNPDSHRDSAGTSAGSVVAGAPAFVAGGKLGGAYIFVAAESAGDPRVRAAIPVSTWKAGAVSVWVRPTMYASGNMMTIWQFPESSNWGHYWLAIHPVTHKVHFHVGTGQGNAAEAVTATTLRDDTWYHLAATWDRTNNTASIYLNGIREATTSVRSWGQQRDQFYWGAGFNGYGLRGFIDEIGIWNRTLTQTEVTTLYNDGRGTPYPFSSASGGYDVISKATREFETCEARVYSVANPITGDRRWLWEAAVLDEILSGIIDKALQLGGPSILTPINLAAGWIYDKADSTFDPVRLWPLLIDPLNDSGGPNANSFTFAVVLDFVRVARNAGGAMRDPTRYQDDLTLTISGPGFAGEESRLLLTKSALQGLDPRKVYIIVPKWEFYKTALALRARGGILGGSPNPKEILVNASVRVRYGPAGQFGTFDDDEQPFRMAVPPSDLSIPTLTGVTNAASFVNGAIAPGETITVWGSGLGPAPGVGSCSDPGAPLSNSTASSAVWIEDTPAPLIYSGAGQINAIVPMSVQPGARVRVQYRGAVSSPLPLDVAGSAPGIYTYSAGRGPAIALNQDGTYNSSSRPAAKESIVAIWATGAGRTTPETKSGGPDATGASPRPRESVQVEVGGVSAEVLYTGVSVGTLLQVNFQIPASVQSGPAVPLVVRIGNQGSQPGVTIFVAP